MPELSNFYLHWYLDTIQSRRGNKEKVFCVWSIEVSATYSGLVNETCKGDYI